MLAELLPAETLHLESSLESMVERSDGAFELGFGGVATPVVADHVVLCLPFTTLRDVDLDGAGLTRKRMKAIDELGMGTNAKVLLQFQDRFPTFGWNGVHAGRAEVRQLGQRARPTGRGRPPHDLHGRRTGAGYPTDDPHAVAPASVVDDALTFLDTYLPGMPIRSTDARGWTRGSTIRG